MKTLVSPTRNRPARISTARTLGWLAAGSLVFAALAPSVAAARPASGQTLDVTICHSTSSDSNPYIVNTPSNPGQLSGHLGHAGPIWTPGADEWGDIIPPIPGLLDQGFNWTAEGQAWWTAGCNAPPDETTTPPDETTTPPDETTTPPDETTTPPDETTTPPATIQDPAIETETATSTVGREPSGDTDPIRLQVVALSPAPTGAVAGVVSAAVTNGPSITLPPTDTISSVPGVPSSVPTWGLILIGLAALIASLLLFPDRTVRRRS